MKTILTTETAKANDLYTVFNCHTSEQHLIDMAADAVLKTLQNEGYDLRRPVILCGGGNNGADGFELACLLKQAGSDVKVVYLGDMIEQPAPKKKEKKKKNAQQPEFDASLVGTPRVEAMSEQCRAHYEKAIAAGIPILCELPEEVLPTLQVEEKPAEADAQVQEQPAEQADETAEQAQEQPEQPKKPAEEQSVVPLPLAGPLITLFVDAVYGTGFRGAITSSRVRTTFARVAESEIPVVAIDIPSGVRCDDGMIDPFALCATQTVTIQAPKVGILLFPGAEYAGKITEACIGIENDPKYNDLFVLGIEDQDVETLLPARPVRSSKATFGRVVVVCGAPGMAGAAYLAATAAYRAGAGLVEIVTNVKNRIILQQLLPEAILTCYKDNSSLSKALKTSIKRADAVVLGCGLGSKKLAVCATKYVLKKSQVPTIVDADAINIIGKKPALLKRVSKKQKPQIILTPHALEAARLLGKKATAEKVLSNLCATSEALTKKYKVNFLLKDTHTLICSADNKTRYINLEGSTALATAGSGDILAGVIGGLAASQTNDQSLVATAALGAYLHGRAGQRAEQKVGAHAAMARDILDGLTK